MLVELGGSFDDDYWKNIGGWWCARFFKTRLDRGKGPKWAGEAVLIYLLEAKVSFWARFS